MSVRESPWIDVLEALVTGNVAVLPIPLGTEPKRVQRRKRQKTNTIHPNREKQKLIKSLMKL